MLGLKYQSQLGIGFEFATCEQKGSLACRAVHRGQVEHVWRRSVGPRHTHGGPQGMKAGGGRGKEGTGSGQQAVVHSMHVCDGWARVLAWSWCLINLLWMSQQIDGQSVNDSDPETGNLLSPSFRGKDMRR